MCRNGGTLDELHKRCKRAQKKFVRLKKSIDSVAAPLEVRHAALCANSAVFWRRGLAAVGVSGRMCATLCRQAGFSGVVHAALLACPSEQRLQ